MPEQCAEYRAIGMDAIIPKPLAIGALFASIEDAIVGAAERVA